MEEPLKRKLDYSDFGSSVHIWWKALFLMPVWGFIAIPFVGALALTLVHNKSLALGHSPGWQGCLALTICSCLFYFFHDLRKRVIYLKNNELALGFRRYALDKLISVGVEYKGQQLTPRVVILRFRDGRLLKLKVSRLRNGQFESLLHYIETRLPQTKIDPVLLTMMRCRRSAGKNISENSDIVEISYSSRYQLAEFVEVFKNTWHEWSKIGPLIVSLFCLPIWLHLIVQLFMFPIALLRIYDNPSNVHLTRSLLQISNFIYENVGALASSNNYEAIARLSEQPISALMLGILSFAIIAGVFRTFLQPNLILVQSNLISLFLRTSFLNICLDRIETASILRVSLFVPFNGADPSRWLMRFHLVKDENVYLKLAALSSQEKSRLTKALQRLAPQIPVDVELMETLNPRAERSHTELWLQSLSSAPERKSLEPLQPGQLLNDSQYQVLRRLGVGGQGSAYLCKDCGLVSSHLSDFVVLKETIMPVYVEADRRMQAIEGFEKEARLLKRLEHPGIVSLRDYFLEDHRGYLVLEHVDGRSLKQIVEEEGVFSEKKVRELALQMAEILEYIHDKGVVHRDFTPDNLILSKSGQLKLIDFNVAQQSEEGSAGTIVGKQSYLPPEQFRGKACSQSDIYAAGACLYYLLTKEEPEPITQSSPLESGAACSQSLDAIVRDCTALALAKRTKSAAELKARLMQYASADFGGTAESEQEVRKSNEQEEDGAAEDAGFVLELAEKEKEKTIKVQEMENA